MAEPIPFSGCVGTVKLPAIGLDGREIASVRLGIYHTQVNPISGYADLRLDLPATGLKFRSDLLFQWRLVTTKARNRLRSERVDAARSVLKECLQVAYTLFGVRANADVRGGRGLKRQPCGGASA